MKREVKIAMWAIIVMVFILIPAAIFNGFYNGSKKTSEVEMTKSVRFLGLNNKRPSTYTFTEESSRVWFEVNYNPSVINKNDLGKYKPYNVLCITYVAVLYEDGRVFNRLNKIIDGSCQDGNK